MIKPECLKRIFDFSALKILAPLIFLAVSIPGLAQSINITASVDRNPVGANEQFTYSVEVSGSSSNLPDPGMPAFNNFRVLGGPNVSTSVQIVNGAVSSSKTYSVILLPREAGEFEIPAVSLSHRGKTYHSNAIKMIVTEEGSQPQEQKKGTQDRRQQEVNNSQELFIRVTPSRRTVYVNEQFNVSYKVYFRVPIRNPDFIKLPETVGFWVEEYDIPQNIPVTQEVINGVRYNVAEVKKMALFPTKSGELTLSPMQLAVNVVERRRRDPFSTFDSFFDDAFGRTVRKVLTTNPLKINVKPLPAAGKPDSFSGLVGNFRMQVDLDKTAVKANEAISYKIRLTGSGHLKSLGDIPIDFPASFEVYDPKINDTVNRSGQNLVASRELEYVLIPRMPGKYELKPFEISFFDPSANQYKTLGSPEYLITVGEGKEVEGVANNAYLSKSEVKLLGKDINFIKEENLDLRPRGYKPYQTFWFWLALILPVLFLTTVYGLRNHMEKMATNVEYARRRKAFKQAEKRLRVATQFLKQQKFAEFYGEVSRGLIGFVADKTNHSAAGLLRDDVARLLNESNVDEVLVRDYLKYLDEADYRRFAPGTLNEEEAHAFYKQAKEILVKLGKYF